MKRQFHEYCSKSYVADSKINVVNFTKGLQNCSNPILKGKVIRGITNGFQLGLEKNDNVFTHNVRNIATSIKEKCAIAQDFITEIKAGRIQLSKERPQCVNPVTVIPKDETKYRLIRNLSFPENKSLNDAIASEAKYVQFPTHSFLARRICKEGRGAYIARQDLSNAYRQIKMHHTASSYLGYKFLGRWLVDRFLVFGLASACNIFQSVSLAVIIVFESLYLKHRPDLKQKVHPYLDDFIHIVKKYSDAVFLYESMFCCFLWLGLEVNKDKCLPPCQHQLVLGLHYDTSSMTVQLPKEKQSKYSDLITKYLQQGYIVKKELHSLIGKLQFSAAVIIPGKAFLSGLRKLYYESDGNDSHNVTLPNEICIDLLWWLTALKHLNGIPLKIPAGISLPEIHLFTDASLFAVGGILNNSCYAYRLPCWNELRNCHIAIIELYAVVIAITTWAKDLREKHVKINIDSRHCKAALQKMNDKNKTMMTFVRFISMKSLEFKFTYELNWIPSKQNELADSLSRLNFKKFDLCCKKQNIHPIFVTPIFENFWQW